MAENSTVRSVTHDLLRSLRLTTVFGNPGSTEETFLQDFPDDFRYVLALQEASAIAMADAFAQVTRRPGPGQPALLGGGGKRHGQPGNREASTMPKPWVKWSYEPYRAQDVPEAFMRAYAMAVQPPAGPVFLSIPLDDWNQPLAGPARVRAVSTKVAPEADRLREFAAARPLRRDPRTGRPRARCRGSRRTCRSR